MEMRVRPTPGKAKRLGSAMADGGFTLGLFRTSHEIINSFLFLVKLVSIWFLNPKECWQDLNAESPGGP